MKSPIALAAVVLAAAGFAGGAAAATLDTTRWIGTTAPFVKFESNPGQPARFWDRGVGFAQRSISGATGTLHSRDPIDGDFTFSGFFSSVPFAWAGNPSYYDDDPLGVVFGWQDAANHYRLGINGSRGSSYVDEGSSNETGIVFIRETNGIDTVIYNDPDLAYMPDGEYRFSVSRKSDIVSFSLTGEFYSRLSGATSSMTVSFGTIDTVFQSGAIGVYSVSTPGRFDRLALMAETPLPAPFALLIASIGALALQRRSNAASRRRGPL